MAGLSDEIPKLLLINGSSNPRPRFQKSKPGAPFGSLGPVNGRKSPSSIESTLKGTILLSGYPAPSGVEGAGL